MTRIAFIGLGNMGLPMARNLARAGHEVRGFDVVDAARDRARAAGLDVGETIAEAVRDAGCVVTMLPAGAHVREVLTGEGGVLAHLPRGALAIESSTIDIETARAMHEAAAAQGIAIVDAPVSGGVGGAEAASLTFMVGGSAEAFDCAKPLLEAMGKTIVHAGAAGCGQAAKLCNNMILGVSMIAVCEAFALAEKIGLAPSSLFEISSKSSGQCWSLTSYCPEPGIVPTAPANRDYQGGFASALMLKDLTLAAAAAHDAGAAVPLGEAARALYQKLVEQGEGGRDFSVMLQALKQGAIKGSASF
jgi:3-hydroxyisobutyrate dehydrogenase